MSFSPCMRDVNWLPLSSSVKRYSKTTFSTLWRPMFLRPDDSFSRTCCIQGDLIPFFRRLALSWTLFISVKASCLFHWSSTVLPYSLLYCILLDVANFQIVYNLLYLDLSVSYTPEMFFNLSWFFFFSRLFRERVQTVHVIMMNFDAFVCLSVYCGSLKCASLMFASISLFLLNIVTM